MALRVWIRGRADVRQQGHVVELQERRIDLGLAHEHVEAGAQDRAALQRRDQRRLVDHAAARHVDQDAARAQRFEHRAH